MFQPREVSDFIINKTKQKASQLFFAIKVGRSSYNQKQAISSSFLFSNILYTNIHSKNYKAHQNHQLISFFIGHFKYSANFELYYSWFPAACHCLMSSCMFSEVISRFWFLSLVQSNVILVWSYIQIFQTVFNNAAGDLSERTSQKQLMIICFWEEIHIDQSLWIICISAILPDVCGILCNRGSTGVNSASQ